MGEGPGILRGRREPAGSRGWLGLVVAVGLCEVAGVFGVLLTDTGRSPWYRSLRKPRFSPPPAVFGPVWTFLYLLMGVSLHRLWRCRRRAGGRPALRAFGLQLSLNAIWTPVFFGLHSIAGGLAVIVALWAAILLTLKRTWHVARPAAALLVPYFLWVSFATVLNTSLLTMNRSRVPGPSDD